MSSDPTTVVQAFAAAAASGDEAAAAGLSSPFSWAADHGDSPSRLFAKARHPQRGFSIEVKDVQSAADSTRAAVRVELVHPERGAMAEVHLLGQSVSADDTAWKLGGVSKMPRFVDAFLSGALPALLDFDALPVDGDAADSVLAISALAQQAMHGNEQARVLVESLMNETEQSYKGVGWLQNAARFGWQVRVQDARRAAGLNRSVVRAVVVKPDPGLRPELVWIYGESGPPISWYAHTTYFSPDTLLA